MKAGKAHTVPLAPRAVAILKAMREHGSTWVFPGLRDGEPLSNMAMLELLKRMKRRDLTVHGFRSTARDWAAESTAYPAEVCEMALAHRIPDKAEAAYRRGELLEKRRNLMRDWQKYIDTPRTKATVTRIRRRSKGAPG
jgi:integrase